MVVDGAQAVPHMPVDVQAIDADFMHLVVTKCVDQLELVSFMANVIYWNKWNLWNLVAEMIDFVHLQESTWKELP